MKTIIVLAMHGVPPSDFPKNELAELMSLEARLARGADDDGCRTRHERRASGDQYNSPEGEFAALELRFADLDTKIRNWPRTRENDPYHAASHELAGRLSRVIGYEVIVGFNEFCGPNLDEALDRAAHEAMRVVIATAMITSGGKHSEVEIPEAVHRAERRHPRVKFVYAWPFDAEKSAEFLAEHIRRFLR
jgi:sirohydrochlorin cobaltochelatase